MPRPILETLHHLEGGAFLNGAADGLAEIVKSAWYWTRAQHAADAGYAWIQLFDYGGQDYYRKSYEGRARAVRRLEIQ